MANIIQQDQRSSGSMVLLEFFMGLPDDQPVSRKKVLSVLNQKAGKTKGEKWGEWNQYNARPTIKALKPEFRDRIVDKQRVQHDRGAVGDVSQSKMVALAKALRDIKNQLDISWTDYGMDYALELIIGRKKWDPDWHTPKAESNQTEINFEKEKVDQFYVQQGQPE